MSQRSTPRDPSEISRNALPGALSRTSQRSWLGPARGYMVMSTPLLFDLLGLRTLVST
jgi:hypothetical protein